MTRSHRWLLPLRGDQPASRVLGDALAQRLSLVRRAALLAADHAADDREYVHRLRVATRRADAVLRATQVLTGDDAGRDLRRKLRKLRRLAGVARDLDVQLALLLETPFPVSSSTRLAVLHRLVSERGIAQTRLSACVDKLRRKHRFRHWRRWAEQLSWSGTDAEPTGAQVLALGLSEAVRKLAEQGTPWPQQRPAMHRLRMNGKRVRYLGELAAGCFPADTWETLGPRLQQFQDDLGNWHDRQVAVDCWQGWAASPPAGCEVAELAEAARRAVDQEAAARRDCEERWSGPRFQQLLDELSRGLQTLSRIEPTAESPEPGGV